MIKTHEMYLNNKLFTKMSIGTKTIELRLNDEKRRLLNEGDMIKFTNRTTLETILAIIETCINMIHSKNCTITLTKLKWVMTKTK